MSTITKNDKLISLRMPVSVINFAKKNAKMQGRTMSNYLRWLVIEQMDTTDYLLSDPVNKSILLNSIEELKSSKAKMVAKTIKELAELTNI